MKIEAVVFDLDNTLYPEENYFKEIFKVFSIQNNLNVNIFDFLFEEFNTIRFTKKDIFKFALEQAKIYSEDFHNELFALYTEINIPIHPYLGAFEWINYCFEKQIKVGILTNGIINAQKNKWKCLGGDALNVCFIPARIFEKEKPHPSAFDGIMFRLNCPYNQTLFVGDRFENDIRFGIDQGGMGILIGNESNVNVSQFESIQDAFEYFKLHFNQ
jgi:putative hydrolase of the HAD superfamily